MFAQFHYPPTQTLKLHFQTAIDNVGARGKLSIPREEASAPGPARQAIGEPRVRLPTLPMSLFTPSINRVVKQPFRAPRDLLAPLILSRNGGAKPSRCRLLPKPPNLSRKARDGTASQFRLRVLLNCFTDSTQRPSFFM